LQAIDILRPYSTLVRLGAQVFPGLVGDVNVPRVGTGASAAWVGETGTATSGDWTLEQITATPKKVSAYVEISRQLLAQSPAVADRMIANNLLGSVGAAIDSAMLSGTGTDAPVGILNTSGITLTTGTAFNYGAAVTMVKNSASANVNDENIRFVAPPAVRELLAKRAAVVGTGTSVDLPVWRSDRLADKPAAVSANVPSGQVYCGDFSQCWLLTWGIGAMQVEINPYTNFRAGILGAKVVMHCDVAIVRPGAFAVGTGLT
jgi:HK97 family phage major capsid protein